IPEHDVAAFGDAHRFDKARTKTRRGRIRIAIDFDARQALGELAREVLRQAVWVLHRVELDHALGIGDGIGAQRENLGADQGCGRHRILAVAERACACNPSPSASVAAIRPRRCAPSRDTPITLVRFWKSYTPSGDETRAVPAVGST